MTVTPCVKTRFVFFDSREQLQKNGHVQPPQAQSSVLDVSYWEIWFDMVEVISFQYPKKSHKHKRSIIFQGGMAIINARTLTRTHLFMSNETEMQRSMFNTKLAHICAICSLEIPDRSYCGSMNWMLGGVFLAKLSQMLHASNIYRKKSNRNKANVGKCFPYIECLGMLKTSTFL